MFTLVLGSIIALVLYVALGFRRSEELITDAKGNTRKVKSKQREWKSNPAQLLSLAALLVVFFISSITVVPTGYTGILTTFGRVENRTINAGAHMILPWQNVVKMDNRTQKVQITTEAFSSDIQQVNLQLSVNYCIDQETAQELYRTVGISYYENVMYPRILENTKAVFSQYTGKLRRLEDLKMPLFAFPCVDCLFVTENRERAGPAFSRFSSVRHIIERN